MYRAGLGTPWAQFPRASFRRTIMTTTETSFFALAAGDLMTRQLLLIPVDMSLRDAALLFFRNHISGAPVVDDEGRCVGALSNTDLVALALKHGADVVVSAPLPITCTFQARSVGPDARELTTCTLPLGACPL